MKYILNIYLELRKYHKSPNDTKVVLDTKMFAPNNSPYSYG